MNNNLKIIEKNTIKNVKYIDLLDEWDQEDCGCDDCPSIFTKAAQQYIKNYIGIKTEDKIAKLEKCFDQSEIKNCNIRVFERYKPNNEIIIHAHITEFIGTILVNKKFIFDTAFVGTMNKTIIEIDPISIGLVELLPDYIRRGISSNNCRIMYGLPEERKKFQQELLFLLLNK